MPGGDKAMTSKDIRKESRVWLTTLTIGGAVVLLTSAYVFMGTFKSTPYDWNEADRAGQFLVLDGIPVLVVSAILWAARFKKMPSLAFVVTFLIGSFFFLFSLVEIIGELFQGRQEPATAHNFTVVNLMKIFLISGAPLLIVSWFLWAKPKIGSVLLMILGIGMGVFMYSIRWGTPEKTEDWIIYASFTVVPFVLGLFNLIRETTNPSRPLANNT